MGRRESAPFTIPPEAGKLKCRDQGSREAAGQRRPSRPAALSETGLLSSGRNMTVSHFDGLFRKPFRQAQGRQPAEWLKARSGGATS